MANKSALSPLAIEDRVRAVAYSLWLEEGQPEGRAEDHWFKAVQQVNAEAAVEAAPKARAKSKAPAAAVRKAAPAKRAPARKS